MQKVLQAQQLRAQCATIFVAAGSSTEEATKVAANLVMANLSGHDSHGVGMLPRYVDAVLEGALRPNAEVKVLLDTGSMLSLNGQRGYGQVIGEEAMRLGISRAKAHGSCIVALAESHHLGRIGHFAEMAVAENLVSLHFVNVMTRAIVAPWGGSDGRYGTNPCCIGIPLQDQPPFVLDFATSRVAQGKMRVAHNQQKEVTPGLLIDEQGQPTNNPSVVVVAQGNGLFGALMPFGEHKGYGLAVACELLGGALGGGGTWHQAKPTGRAVFNGMLTIIIDPAKLGTQASFESEALGFVEWLRKSPPSEGFDGVQIAGEAERRARAARETNGIEIDLHTWQELVEAGRKVGVEV